MFKSIDNMLSKYQVGYREGYSSQKLLVLMFEKRRRNLDKLGKYGASLLDLSCLKNFIMYLRIYCQLSKIRMVLTANVLNQFRVFQAT